MNVRSSPSSESQRRQVATILWIGALVLAVLGFGVWMPLRERGEQAVHTLRQVEADIQNFRTHYGDKPIASHVALARRRHKELEGEWRELRRRVDTFHGRPPLMDGLPKDNEGRIDFKVALFEARTRLQEAASAQGVSLPTDLGIPETIGTEEQAETRLWQLAATVKLVEQVVALGVVAIDRIESAAPVVHEEVSPDDGWVEEYPVRLILQCGFEDIDPLLERLSGDGSFFAVRHFRVERVGAEATAPLRLDLRCGAEVFRVRPPAAEREAQS